MGSVGREAEAGVALLAVMLGLAVLSVLALGMVLATNAGTQEARFDIQSSESRAFFMAIILQVGSSLADTDEDVRPMVDGVPQRITVGDQSVQVKVTSEFGKLDINDASVETLTRLIEATGEGPDESLHIASEIVQRRISGNGMDLNRPFRTDSELFDVPGMSENLYEKILPAITVYSGRAQIDESTAPLLALEAMPGMDPLSAAALVQSRLDGQTIDDVKDGKLAQGIDITGWAFSIDAWFNYASKSWYGAAVIRMTGDPANPYLVLSYQEGP